MWFKRIWVGGIHCGIAVIDMFEGRIISTNIVVKNKTGPSLIQLLMFLIIVEEFGLDIVMEN